ncbi:MAG TPA: tyrosine-type recombinase/integrase [Bryocella sp.]|nr:tyrosine-type recombinase/integrase [Bryocella sp.]
MGVSHQKGWVRLRGRKWHGCFRRTELDPKTKEPKLVTHSFVLGLKSEFSKSEAREKLEDEIAKLGGRATGDQVPINGSVTFEWFVKNRYLPLKEGDWREETAKIKKYLIQADLVDFFADYRLENFDRIILQTHLNQLAKTRSRDRVLQIRAYVRDIFAEAVDQGFLAKDPARKLKPPVNLRETDKTVLTWDQLAAALKKLDLRDRILLRLDITNALRPGELFAPRWKCHHAEKLSLSIVETLYKGKIRPYGKTKGSLREVPISEDVSKDLVLWRKVSQERYDKKKKKRGLSPSDPEAPIFPGRFGGFLDSGNYRKRVLHKLAAELELPKLTFQVIRRTTATLAQKKGTVKDVQGVMGHSRLATTTDIYMQPIPESVRATVDSLDRELQVTMKKLSGSAKVLPSTATPTTAMVQ